MRFSHKIMIVVLGLSLLSGMIGGLTVQLLLIKRTPRLWMVVDTTRLIQDQVAWLQRQPGDAAELTAHTNKIAPWLRTILAQWADQRGVVLLNKTGVLSTLPDATTELQAYIKAQQP